MKKLTQYDYAMCAIISQEWPKVHKGISAPGLNYGNIKATGSTKNKHALMDENNGTSWFVSYSSVEEFLDAMDVVLNAKRYKLTTEMNALEMLYNIVTGGYCTSATCFYNAALHLEKYFPHWKNANYGELEHSVNVIKEWSSIASAGQARPIDPVALQLIKNDKAHSFAGTGAANSIDIENKVITPSIALFYGHTVAHLKSKKTLTIQELNTRADELLSEGLKSPKLALSLRSYLVGQRGEDYAEQRIPFFTIKNMKENQSGEFEAMSEIGLNNNPSKIPNKYIGGKKKLYGSRFYFQ